MLSDESHPVLGGPNSVDKVPKTREGEVHFSKGQRRGAGAAPLHHMSCPRWGAAPMWPGKMKTGGK